MALLRQPIQYLYPLESAPEPVPATTSNPCAESTVNSGRSRPLRVTAQLARFRIVEQLKDKWLLPVD